MTVDAHPTAPDGSVTLAHAEATLVLSALCLAAAYLLEERRPADRLAAAMRAEAFLALRDRVLREVAAFDIRSE